jgi:hypothetical protein
MSDFYKYKKKIIVKNYKYIGIDYIFFSRIFIIMFFLILIKLLSNLTEKNIIFLALTIWGGLFSSKKYIKVLQENKTTAIDTFIMEPDINLIVVNSLIDEIEKYISRIKTFGSWITGLTFTLISLFITINFNYFIKILDIQLNLLPNNEVSDIVKSIELDDYFLGAITLSFNALSFLCLAIFIIYHLFTISTLTKKQVLLFLYDVRYKILISERQKEENDTKYDVPPIS